MTRWFYLAMVPALVACGSEDDSNAPNGSGMPDAGVSTGGAAGVVGAGGSGGNAGSNNAGGASGTAATAGNGGAGASTGGAQPVDMDSGPDSDAPAAPEFASNTPNATFDPPTDPDGLVRLVSSNLLQSPSGSEYFQEWYGEVENIGAQTLCFVNLSAVFQNAAGTTLASHLAYADAPAYDAGSTLSTPCIAQGEKAGMYSNAFAASVIDLDLVTTVDLTWDGLIDPTAVPHPLTPTTVSIDIVSNTWIEGTMRNDASMAIYNIGLDFYARGADGLLFDRLSDFHLETFLPAATWNFMTLSTQQPFSEYLEAVNFIEGAAPP